MKPVLGKPGSELEGPSPFNAPPLLLLSLHPDTYSGGPAGRSSVFWKECDALASVEVFLVPVPEVSAGLGLTSQHDQRCMLMAPCSHVAVSAARP